MHPLTRLGALLMLTGCYSNTWEIAITGHVYDVIDEGLLAAGTDDVDLCWSIDTHVEPTDRRKEALCGCETLLTTPSGSFETVLYGIGGAYVEDLTVELWRDGEVARGSVISQHTFNVSCPSTYAYTDDSMTVYYTEDECADDLLEAISYQFIFPE